MLFQNITLLFLSFKKIEKMKVQINIISFSNCLKSTTDQEFEGNFQYKPHESLVIICSFTKMLQSIGQKSPNF